MSSSSSLKVILDSTLTINQDFKKKAKKNEQNTSTTTTTTTTMPLSTLTSTSTSNTTQQDPLLSVDLDSFVEYHLVHKVQEHDTSLYTETTRNGLVNAFLMAYNHHLPLRLRPDDIHCALQFVFSTFINNHAEEFRHLFVDHDGRKELSVEYDQFDWTVFSRLMMDTVKANVVDPGLFGCLETSYSTSNDVTRTVFRMLILNTLKEYFSYDFIMGCGIPSVVLVGTQQDWELLQSNYNNIIRAFVLRQNGGDNELQRWVPCMDLLMNMFVDLRRLQPGGTVQAPPHYKALWERVISFVPQGSGGDTLLGGWVSVLCPYSSNNTVKDLFKDLPCLDVEKSIPKRDKSVHGWYGYQDVLKKFYGGTGWSTLQSTMFDTPAVLSYGVNKTKINIACGLSNEVYLNELLEVEVNFEYQISIKDERFEQFRQRLLDMGFQFDKYYRQIKCPKERKDYIPIAKKVFNATCAYVEGKWVEENY